MKQFFILFLALTMSTIFSACGDDDNLVFVTGVVRNYGGLSLSSCGWVIEIIDQEGNLEVLKPLNLDPAFEIDNFVVNISYDETSGITTCNQGALIIQTTDILINQIN